MGINCRYDGRGKKVSWRLPRGTFVPVCPEQLGGLSTPRPCAEIQGGDGEDVLAGRAKVITISGEDVTTFYLKGARETYKIACLTGAKEGFFQDRSPACGCGLIYDGTFQGILRPGNGVTTAFLKQKGLKVYPAESYISMRKK